MSVATGADKLQPVFVGFGDLTPSCLLDPNIAAHLVLDGRTVFPVQYTGRIAGAVQDQSDVLGHDLIISRLASGSEAGVTRVA